jgi:carboxymethylenebutenolidase
LPDIGLSEFGTRGDGSTRLGGYLVKPDGEAPWPGVLMIHETWGLDAVMRQQADRLAAMGYLTLAVDLFSDGGTARCLVSTMRAMITGKGKAFADIQTARGWLLESPDCTGKVGVIGFCMGGGFALLTANTGFDAAASNYGQLSRHLDDALVGACPIVGSYGGADKTLKGAATKLDAALTQAGVVHDIKEYPGAGHTFFNDEENGPRVLRPLFRLAGMGPDPVAAADAWSRIDAFFATYLR